MAPEPVLSFLPGKEVHRKDPEGRGGWPPLAISGPLMDKRERVKAALAGRPVYRVPVGFWGHDFLREWTPQGLADAMVESVQRYDIDYLKVNPRATYYAEAWGCRFRPSGDAARGPETEEWVLKSAGDLGKIGPVDVGGGPFSEQLEALGLIDRRLAGEVPFIQTVFSPMSVVGRLANGDLAAVRGYMREAPTALHGALAVVAETLARYVAASLRAGADGVFFATVDWGTYDNCSREEYAGFGRPYDLRVLRAAQGAWFNVLHVCRQNNMLLDLLDYPVHAFNWAPDQAGNPSLAEAQSKTGKAVMGGLNERTTLREGSPGEVALEAQGALTQTGGRRFLLAPGCSIWPQTPEANLRAAVESARRWSAGAGSPVGPAGGGGAPGSWPARSWAGAPP